MPQQQKMADPVRLADFLERDFACFMDKYVILGLRGHRQLFARVVEVQPGYLTIEELGGELLVLHVREVKSIRIDKATEELRASL